MRAVRPSSTFVKRDLRLSTKRTCPDSPQQAACAVSESTFHHKVPDEPKERHERRARRHVEKRSGQEARTHINAATLKAKRAFVHRMTKANYRDKTLRIRGQNDRAAVYDRPERGLDIGDPVQRQGRDSN